MKGLALVVLGVCVLMLVGCTPETGSVTGLTRTEAGDLEAVVLTCDGSADMVGVERDGDPDAHTDYVWETERTSETLRISLTQVGLEEGDLLGQGGFTSQVFGYDTSHRWNSISVPLTRTVLDDLQHGTVTFGNPEEGQQLQQVSEEDFAASGCDGL